ncbi:cystathionine beta-lyase [Azospirillum sp. A26]
MHWQTRLIHSNAKAPSGFRSLATPVARGSTVIFDSVAQATDDWHQSERGYTYGLFGSPTVLELGARIAELEGAHHSFIVPGGQAAISIVYLALCRAGSHVLLPANAYGPSHDLATGTLRAFGVTVETYDPLIGGDIERLIRPETTLIWTESPGSITMEIQDVPAIAAVGRSHGIPVALDNTYAGGVLFDAFRHGVDISIQALTKYIGGHSDVLLGSVSVASRELYERVGTAWSQLGMGVSPDEASLALRGLQTLGIRLERLERTALAVAQWLADQPEVDKVLHPALTEAPGHDLWKRDFTGSASVFSIIFRHEISPDQVACFVDALRLFKIGYSWGGVTALALTYPGLGRPDAESGDRLVRLNVGLEEPGDLIADLDQALGSAMRQPTTGR